MFLAMVLMVQLNIPREGTVWTQLNRYYDQSHVGFIFIWDDALIVQQPARNAINGVLDPYKAACELLAGTGLYVHQVSDHMMAIHSREHPGTGSADGPQCLLLDDKPPTAQASTGVAKVVVTARRHHTHRSDPSLPDCICIDILGAPWCWRDNDLWFESGCRNL